MSVLDDHFDTYINAAPDIYEAHDYTYSWERVPNLGCDPHYSFERDHDQAESHLISKIPDMTDEHIAAAMGYQMKKGNCSKYLDALQAEHQRRAKNVF